MQTFYRIISKRGRKPAETHQRKVDARIIRKLKLWVEEKRYCLTDQSLADVATSFEVSEETLSYFFSISAKLRPGILVRLGAETTSYCFFAWFDSAGKYFGCGRNFYLSSYDSDVASACPAGKAGRYTVALLPSSYRMSDFLTGKTLSDLTEQIITSWPVTLTDNGVKELAPFRADAVTTENAIYVTKPYSTMQVSAESFSSTSDVLCFSGSIGLDPGLENGKLETLRILTKTDWPTAYVSSVMIGGKSYPLTDPQWNAGNGWYYLQLKDPVDLPCTYSIYASPVSASRYSTRRSPSGVCGSPSTRYSVSGAIPATGASRSRIVSDSTG